TLRRSLAHASGPAASRRRPICSAPMCRLFGMSGAPHHVRATFWRLEAQDSLVVQSHREPDGTGLGYFAADGTPRVDKRPIAAFEDRAFAREGREVHSKTFVA